MTNRTVKAQSGPQTLLSGSESYSGAKICRSKEHPGSTPGHPNFSRVATFAGRAVARLGAIEMSLPVPNPYFASPEALLGFENRRHR
jgi:hypothetical protein